MMKVFAVVAMMMIAMFAGAHAASVDLDQSNFDEKVRASRGSGNRGGGGGGGGGDRSHGGWVGVEGRSWKKSLIGFRETGVRIVSDAGRYIN